MSANQFVLITGTANPPLAHAIAKALNQDIHESVTTFSDGEIRVKIPLNMRRRHVFIIQPTAPPVNDNVMELVFMIDAAKRASADEITVIIPYFGYSRQDRKEMPRVPISSSVVAGIIANAGADRILTVDIHSEQQQGFVRIPWDNLYASYSLVKSIKQAGTKNLVVASPDKGGMVRATGYARLLGAQGVALVYKQRDVQVNNKSETLAMIGDVVGKDILLVDDMIDTGGTIVNAAKLLRDRGAKSIRVASTHGIFSGESLEKIADSEIDEVLTTDTILHTQKVRRHPKIKIISLAPFLAEAIRRIETGESISSLIL